MHQVCILINGGFSPDKSSVDMQTWCRIRAYSAHFVQIWCILFLKNCAFGSLCTLDPSVQSLQKSDMHTLHTFPLVCKVCTMFQTLTGKSSKTPSNPTPMHMQGIPVSSRSCASWIAATTSMLALRMLPPNDAWLLVSERQRADLMHTCCTHNAYHMHTNYIDCTQNAYCVHTDSIKCTQNKTICVGRFN
jgi:hypothetical protein